MDPKLGAIASAGCLHQFKQGLVGLAEPQDFDLVLTWCQLGADFPGDFRGGFRGCCSQAYSKINCCAVGSRRLLTPRPSSRRGRRTSCSRPNKKHPNALQTVERLANEAGLADRVHLWPDKSLGSQAAVNHLSKTTRLSTDQIRQWLHRCWNRISEWPFTASSASRPEAPVCASAPPHRLNQRAQTTTSANRPAS